VQLGGIAGELHGLVATNKIQISKKEINKRIVAFVMATRRLQI
jgi:hypothetical protein